MVWRQTAIKMESTKLAPVTLRLRCRDVIPMLRLPRKVHLLWGFLDGEDDLALFKPRGGVKVSNECITLQNGVKVPWSIGAYLQRARKSSDKVTFGVAYEVQASITYYIMTGYAIISIIRECGSTLYIGIAMVFHYHII